MFSENWFQINAELDVSEFDITLSDLKGKFKQMKDMGGLEKCAEFSNVDEDLGSTKYPIENDILQRVINWKKL